MRLEGGCYCGAVRYVAEGDPVLKAQCVCRECTHITGGGPNLFIAMPPGGFSFVKGATKPFKRSDLERAVTREFCAECGTHLVTRAPGFPAVIVKAGSLDDRSLYGEPDMTIFACDKEAFHYLPQGKPVFDRMPG
jgi:hypothetical protein